jgi:hypothetical protein
VEDLTALKNRFKELDKYLRHLQSIKGGHGFVEFKFDNFNGWMLRADDYQCVTTWGKYNPKHTLVLLSQQWLELQDKIMAIIEDDDEI